MTDTVDWLAGTLRAGDLVVVAGGTGEPTPLLEDLVRCRDTLPDVEIFVGLSHSRALTDPGARDLSWVSFGAMGPLASLAAAGAVSIIPCNFSDVPRLLAVRAPGRLVLVVQVSPADEDGCHSLGLAVDYCYELLDHARAVVAEVNDQLPITSAPRIHGSRFSATVHTSRPPGTLKEAVRTDLHRRIAANVADLVPDAATIQLGVGAVPSVLGDALAGKRDLRVHSTLTGDWLLRLAEAGALSAARGAVLISEAAGSRPLYDYVVDARVTIRPVGELADGLARIERLVAMNSALQVDLSGQVNAEEIGSGYVGGIGGQAEYLRAAQRSPGGQAIVMLPATAAKGQQSRIVRRLHAGTVTTPRSAVDFVVTEYGVADLRGRSTAERAEALVAVAAPEHRAELRAAW